ncbi:hypothetical protein PPROV_000162100 [Pycnococcus provasolii]|uniref:Methyltransferase domain-containing protein n=1 Tax=Pycnococcus provasolii TaxID=41880 RepID=A0A830H6L9_9CHLO|nr:hypothetical protein PPROV_000162100 [Pycnococcus provasolii]
MIRSKHGAARANPSERAKAPKVRSGPDGVRNRYAADGVDGYYAAEGGVYTNPHEGGLAELLVGAVGRWPADFAAPAGPPDGTTRRAALDLCCGSGEASAALVAAGVAAASVDACDPYTGEAYRKRHGRDAFPWSFADLAGGSLEGRQWGCVVVSFALHLCAPHYLALVCQELARHAGALYVLTPHKRPHIDESTGWRLDTEIRSDAWRVRLRRYVSALADAGG